MNDFDKAGRYLIKCDTAAFLHWRTGHPRLDFHAWIDSRRLALPDQRDLTHDLVAAVRIETGFEAICIELEAEASGDALTRQLAYQTRLWTEPGDANSLELACVSGIVVNLSGRGQARELNLRSTAVPGCRLELAVGLFNLCDEVAADHVANVLATGASPWLLGWVPLMHGGGKSAIIQRWRDMVECSLHDDRRRSSLGLIAQTFARRTGCQNAWDHGLRGWNMQTSSLWDEIRAEGREEGLEALRTLLLHQGRQRFGKAPTKRQQLSIAAIDDLARLEALGMRLLEAGSWSDLLSDNGTH